MNFRGRPGAFRAQRLTSRMPDKRNEEKDMATGGGSSIDPQVLPPFALKNRHGLGEDKTVTVRNLAKRILNFRR